jgi:uncharacterized protein YecE (DUF72 family)
MRIWVGTSGYSYPDWVGSFYPLGVRGPKMLDHYCQVFPLVELNFTYYRLPTPEMLARLAEQAPRGFQFLVKLTRTISHQEQSEDIARFRQAVLEMKKRDCLLGVLCQLPQAAHQTNKRWQWLGGLFAELRDLHLAIEFRHRSWAEPEVAERLRNAQVDLVAVDVPDLPDLYPRGLVYSTSRVYVRLHSRNAANWYRSDRDRYDYDYSDAEMKEWILDLIRVKDQAQQAFVLFNNCHHAQAAANAKRFQELLRSLPESAEVVEARALPPRQKTLFD